MTHFLAGRKQSPEHVAKRTESVRIAKSLWSAERNEQFRKAVSVSAKGRPAWNKGLKGVMVAWNKGKSCLQLSGENHGMFGKHHTPEAIEKSRSKKIGIKQSPEHIQKRVDGRAGYQHSEETKKQIRETNLRTWAIPEVRNQSVGENNPTWKDGISFVPYPVQFNTILKERIRNRDGRICQACGKTEEENGQRLDIHHVDYDKKNLSDENFISLCFSCHRKSFNRNRLTGRGATLPLNLG